MSNSSSSVIRRQWQIITYLIKTDRYVSSNDIQDHLNQHGHKAEIRTIQRDLQTLQDSFPLECRKDDKPYSWRWQRLPNSNQHTLSLQQALVLRLLETELKHMLPNDILDLLEPLLMRARLLLAEADTRISLPELPLRRDDDRHLSSHPYDLNLEDIHWANASLADKIAISAGKLKDKLTPSKPKPSQHLQDQRVNTPNRLSETVDPEVIRQLQQHLQQLQLSEMAAVMEGLLADNTNKICTN